MKNYETPKAVVRAFSEQDVMTTSTTDLNVFDDVGTWGDWFNATEGGEQ